MPRTEQRACNRSQRSVNKLDVYFCQTTLHYNTEAKETNRHRKPQGQVNVSLTRNVLGRQTDGQTDRDRQTHTFSCINCLKSLNPAVCRSLRHLPMSAVQKMLYPCQLDFVPPSCSLQSVPHPVSKSSVPLALLKLPLGNLTPYRKPESACSHRRTHTRHTYKHGEKDQHMQLAVF